MSGDSLDGEGLNGGLTPRSAQETLRLHPSVLDMQREATKDDVLPLSKPIVGVSGKVYGELPVPAGILIYISTVGYNLYVHSLAPCPGRNSVVEAGSYHFTGTRICGDQTPTSSNQSDG